MSKPPIMTNAGEVIFVGVKSKVLALSRRDGRIFWFTELPGGLSHGFVTVLSDGSHIFAHTHGRLYCLEPASGRVLWTNELPGCGYGIASLCFPEGGAAPSVEAVEHFLAAQQQAAASNAGTTS